MTHLTKRFKFPEHDYRVEYTQFQGKNNGQKRSGMLAILSKDGKRVGFGTAYHHPKATQNLRFLRFIALNRALKAIETNCEKEGFYGTNDDSIAVTVQEPNFWRGGSRPKPARLEMSSLEGDAPTMKGFGTAENFYPSQLHLSPHV